jgi:hypothetical protein
MHVANSARRVRSLRAGLSSVARTMQSLRLDSASACRKQNGVSNTDPAPPCANERGVCMPGESCDPDGLIRCSRFLLAAARTPWHSASRCAHCVCLAAASTCNHAARVARTRWPSLSSLHAHQRAAPIRSFHLAYPRESTAGDWGLSMPAARCHPSRGGPARRVLKAPSNLCTACNLRHARAKSMEQPRANSLAPRVDGRRNVLARPAQHHLQSKTSLHATSHHRGQRTRLARADAHQPHTINKTTRRNRRHP